MRESISVDDGYCSAHLEVEKRKPSLRGDTTPGRANCSAHLEVEKRKPSLRGDTTLGRTNCTMAALANFNGGQASMPKFDRSFVCVCFFRGGVERPGGKLVRSSSLRTGFLQGEGERREHVLCIEVYFVRYK
jgi:hypothetical protein